MLNLYKPNKYKEMVHLILYTIIALFHGLWALKMQNKYHPKHTELWRMIIVFVINSVGFPITAPWAMINKQLW